MSLSAQRSLDTPDLTTGLAIVSSTAIGPTSFAVKPCGERKGGRNLRGLFDKAEENGLGDVAGGFVVGGDASGD